MIDGVRILAALDCAILKWEARRYALVGEPPGWWPAPERDFPLAERFPFLESFLPEAESCWAAPHAEPLRNTAGSRGRYRRQLDLESERLATAHRRARR